MSRNFRSAKSLSSGTKDFIKWDQPKSVEGILVAVRWNVGDHGSMEISIRDEKTGVDKTFFTTMILTERFENHGLIVEREVKVGAYVKVEFLGNKKKKKGTGTYKDFDVHVAVDDQNNIEICEIPEAAEQEEEDGAPSNTAAPAVASSSVAQGQMMDEEEGDEEPPF